SKLNTKSPLHPSKPTASSNCDDGVAKMIRCDSFGAVSKSKASTLGPVRRHVDGIGLDKLRSEGVGEGNGARNVTELNRFESLQPNLRSVQRPLPGVGGLSLCDGLGSLPHRGHSEILRLISIGKFLPLGHEPLGGEGGLNLWGIGERLPHGGHAQIFFLRGGDLIISNGIKSIKQPAV